MENIKDKLHIVKGHTYEEYKNKYGKKYEQGKLSIYDGDKLEYLKQSKIYWEVKGPNGKTLYCQIKKLRPSYVLIPLTVIALSLTALGLGLVVGYFTIKRNSFNGQVSETQWQTSLENIVHIKNFTKKLNYTTKSSVVLNDVRGGGIKHELKNLVVDGNLEEAEDAKGTKVYMYDYNHLPLKYVDGTTTVWNSMLHDYIGYAFGNFYDSFNDGFKFDEKSKSYSYESKTGEIEGIENVKCSVTFDSPSTIKKLSCSYDMMYGDNKELGETFSGEFEYTYGNAHLESWGGETEEILKKHLINKDSSGVTTTDSSVTIPRDLFKDFITTGQNFIISLDYSNSKNVELPLGLQDFRMLNSKGISATFWFYSVKVFNHGVELERGSDADWQYIYRKSDKYVEGFRLSTPTTSDDQITILISLDTTEKRVGGYDHISITKATN